MKEKLDLLYERLSDIEEEQRLYALAELKKEVAGATTSMTSVPKPLKFLSKHYEGLKTLYNSLPSSNFKVLIDECLINDVNQIFSLFIE